MGNAAEPTPLIDLHTHSNRSDGTDDPAALIRRAKETGLAVVALTDHDTTAGWPEATAAAAEIGIELVCGLELSVEDGGQGHHLLAYEPDPEDDGLRAMLRRSVEARDERIPAMVERIAVEVPALRLDDVLAIADTAVAGRPHLAEALVRCGASPDRASAFAEYLVPGRPTYSETWSPPMEDAIRVITAAGGVAVIAHPWARKTRVTRDRFEELTQIGLVGIEVDHQEHNSEMRQELRRIAVNLGLIVTGSSDYHGTRKINHELGCNLTALAEYDRLKAVWGRAKAVHNGLDVAGDVGPIVGAYEGADATALHTRSSRSDATEPPLDLVEKANLPENTSASDTDSDFARCMNCQEPLVGRRSSKRRGPDCAWFKQCAQCAESIKGHLELVLDRPNGHPIQIYRCVYCGSERACRPGWTTRCHVCHDDRTATGWLKEATADFTRWLSQLSPDEASEVQRELREFAMSDDRDPDALDIASFLAANTLAMEMDRRAQVGWTLLATDIWGMPWMDGPERGFSHGTWATHNECGKVQKLQPGRGHTECRTCPPDPSSRTHRARQHDKHLLYLVGFENLIKFGHGGSSRVRDHLRAGATLIQVLEAPHGEVVRAELILKRQHARIRRLQLGGMPTTFVVGTEVLPAAMTFDLRDALHGTDVTTRFN